MVAGGNRLSPTGADSGDRHGGIRGRRFNKNEIFRLSEFIDTLRRCYQQRLPYSITFISFITIGVSGLPFLSRGIFKKPSTVSIPSITLPKAAYSPSREVTSA